MAAKKKASRKRARRRVNAAVLLGSMVIRAALLDAAAPADSWLVIRVDPTEAASSGEVVHVGARDECALWVAQAASGFSYLLVDLKSARSITK